MRSARRGVEAGQFEAIAQAERHDLPPDPADGLGADAPVVDGDVARHLQRERPQGERGARRGDDARVPGSGQHAQVIAEFVADVAHHAALVAAPERVALHEALAEANDAQPEALRQLHPGRGAERDLRAAAADVDDHRLAGRRRRCRAPPRVWMSDASSTPVMTRAWMPGLRRDRGEEVAAVGRLAHGAGGHGHDIVDLAGVGEAFEPRRASAARPPSRRRRADGPRGRRPPAAPCPSRAR